MEIHQDNARKPLANGWLILLLVFGCSLVFEVMRMNAFVDQDLPIGIGLLVVAVTAGLYYWFAARRTLSWSIVATVFFAISAVIGTLSGLGGHVARLKAAVGSLESVALGNETQYTSNNEGPKTTTEQFLDLAGVFAAKKQTLLSAYNVSIEQSGAATLFDASRLNSDKNLKESHAIIERMLTATVHLDSSLTLHFKNFVSRIEALDLPEKQRQLVRTKVNENLLTKVFALEREAILHCQTTIDYLRKERRGWHVSNGEVTFKDDAKQQKFYDHLNSLDSLVTLQDSITKVADSTMRANFALMKGL